MATVTSQALHIKRTLTLFRKSVSQAYHSRHMAYISLRANVPQVSYNGLRWQYVTRKRYASIFAKKCGTILRYAFLVMVLVRHIGTLFELAYLTYQTYRIYWYGMFC